MCISIQNGHNKTKIKLIFYFWTLTSVAKYWPNIGHLSINMSFKISAESADVTTECQSTYQLFQLLADEVPSAVGRYVD